MTNNLNEQMREKAEKLIDHVIAVGWEADGQIIEALQEAHANGRQEILDRLPSDIEIAEAYDAKRAAVGGRGNTIHMMAGWIEAYREIKSRLTGEV